MYILSQFSLKDQNDYQNCDLWEVFHLHTGKIVTMAKTYFMLNVAVQKVAECCRNLNKSGDKETKRYSLSSRTDKLIIFNLLCFVGFRRRRYSALTEFVENVGKNYYF